MRRADSQYVCTYVCDRALYDNIEGGRPQGHHHFNGDALVGYGPRLLLIRPNPIQPFRVEMV